MTIDLTPYLSTQGPKYLAIARALAEALRHGAISPGMRLPTHRELAETLGVSVQTVSRAYEQAEKSGLVQARVGSGTWIRDTEGDTENEFLRAPATLADDSLIDLSIAHPVCLPSHHLRFREALAELARTAHADVIGACRPIAGLIHQRERADAWLRERLGVPGEVEERLLCNGAAHGLMLAIATVVQHGDVVLTESLTDHGLISLARTLGFQLRGVAIDRQGVIPEALEAAIVRHRPRAVCLTPTQLNPTGATMENARRDAVARVLERHGVADRGRRPCPARTAGTDPAHRAPAAAELPCHQPDQGHRTRTARRLSQRAPRADAPHPAAPARHQLDGDAAGVRAGRLLARQRHDRYARA
ncbi:PLP-dependent aminotransferase family protein [Salinicola tamaricis]|uniref:aminotransferase-like domain-containing protein n=1 Tax=Salinicola tamaricis TaxID=1771309 RepID=UPI001F5DBF43|nr:PLP-dependent aminotransferase family protein [Salinicola tamaricis]